MIPKILHVIWLGAMPKRVSRRLDKWRDLNPQWELRLWQDRNISGLENYEVAMRCSTAAGSSDVLRYSAIKKYGGAYFDADFEPVRPISKLLNKGASIICRAGPGKGFLNNAFFAEIPDGPMMNSCVERLSRRIDYNVSPVRGTGPRFFAEAIEHIKDIREIPPFTFYPYRYGDPPLLAHQCPPETVAIHLWEASWKDDASEVYG